MARIFISYRRSDSRKWANKLFEHISMRFGKDLVFQDVDDIKPGKDFLLVLHEAIKGPRPPTPARLFSQERSHGSARFGAAGGV